MRKFIWFHWIYNKTKTQTTRFLCCFSRLMRAVNVKTGPIMRHSKSITLKLVHSKAYLSVIVLPESALSTFKWNFKARAEKRQRQNRLFSKLFRTFRFQWENCHMWQCQKRTCRKHMSMQDCLFSFWCRVPRFHHNYPFLHTVMAKTANSKSRKFNWNVSRRRWENGRRMEWIRNN